MLLFIFRIAITSLCVGSFVACLFGSLFRLFENVYIYIYDHVGKRGEGDGEDEDDKEDREEEVFYG